MRAGTTFETSAGRVPAAMPHPSGSDRCAACLRSPVVSQVAFGGSDHGSWRHYCGSDLKTATSKPDSLPVAVSATCLSLPKSTADYRSTGFISGQAGHGIFYRCGPGPIDQTARTGTSIVPSATSARTARTRAILSSTPLRIHASRATGHWQQRGATKSASCGHRRSDLSAVAAGA